MSQTAPRTTTRGQRLLGAATALVFLLLVGRLWELQVVTGETYEQAAAENRTRLVRTPAPRGRILDASGRPLADTRPVLVVTLDPAAVGELDVDERASLFTALAAELRFAGRPEEASLLPARWEQDGTGPEPVVVATDVSTDLWLAIEERAMPGVVVEERPQRTYPSGSVAAHVVGHLGTVADDAEAVTLNRTTAGAYQPGDVIGRAGIELAFEAYLSGVPGLRRIEVDAANRVVRTVEVVRPALPGADVHLTIDLDLQREAENAIQAQLAIARERAAAEIASTLGGVPGSAACDACPVPTVGAGSLVAVDPADGSLVALASYPTFDPSWFVGGLSAERAGRLFEDELNPLLNRAVAGRYPAGSTFKPVTAYASLVAGVRPADEIWIDQGRHELDACRGVDGGGGCVFRNSGSVAMGPVDLRAALARSSDTYFYSLGERVWTDRARYGETPIQSAATAFGFGRRTGVALAGERAGFVPSPVSGPWYTGDNVNLAIGQGDLLVTPLQLANAYAALATRGDRHRPRLVSHVTDGVTGQIVHVVEPERIDDGPLDRSALAAIEAGLVDATRTGTAAGAFTGFPLDEVPIAGKTGTAQVTGRADFSLFAAYGPVGQPRYAVAVVLEEAGFGGLAAAPAARRFFDSALTTPQPSDPAPVSLAPVLPAAAGPGTAAGSPVHFAAGPGTVGQPPLDVAAAGSGADSDWTAAAPGADSDWATATGSGAGGERGASVDTGANRGGRS